MATERIMRKLSGGGRTGVFLAVIVVTLVALFLPGWWGAIPLCAVVAGLAWLMTKTWSVTAPRTRLLRLVILAILASMAIAKILR